MVQINGSLGMDALRWLPGVAKHCLHPLIIQSRSGCLTTIILMTSCYWSCDLHLQSLLAFPESSKTRKVASCGCLPRGLPLVSGVWLKELPIGKISAPCGTQTLRQPTFSLCPNGARDCLMTATGSSGIAVVEHSSNVSILLNDCFIKQLMILSQLWLQVEDYP